jgi:hypothetical protein
MYVFISSFEDGKIRWLYMLHGSTTEVGTSYTRIPGLGVTAIHNMTRHIENPNTSDEEHGNQSTIHRQVAKGNASIGYNYRFEYTLRSKTTTYFYQTLYPASLHSALTPKSFSSTPNASSTLFSKPLILSATVSLTFR